jgi:hypothetical protein
VTLQHNKSQLRNIVQAFAWCQEDCEPVSFDFTLSLGSHNFQVTESVLHDLELTCAGDVTPDLIWLQKYDTTEGLWVGFKIGQVFDAESNASHFPYKICRLWPDRKGVVESLFDRPGMVPEQGREAE